MTCRDIQRSIIAQRYHKAFVIPNHTPRGWYESDVVEISKAGFFTEYEIKMSVSDFRADAAKGRGGTKFFSPQFAHLNKPETMKHDQLAARDTKGPSRFWFVTPRGLLNATDIPPWAGLMEAYAHADERYHPFLNVVRPAPRIHNERANPALKEYGLVSCYWRMHRLYLGDRTAVLEPDKEWVE